MLSGFRAVVLLLLIHCVLFSFHYLWGVLCWVLVLLLAEIAKVVLSRVAKWHGGLSRVAKIV